MSQENIYDKVRVQFELSQKLPPLRSISTKPQNRGILGNSNKNELALNKETGVKENSKTFNLVTQQMNDSNQDLGILLEQQKLQNKLNDQEIQAINNRIQFIQNQQTNIWKKTNEVYEKAVLVYENKKRNQLERNLREFLKEQKEIEIEKLQSQNEQRKGSIRQKLAFNHEQLIQNKKKQAQEIKDKSRELHQIRDYFRNTFQRDKKQKCEAIKSGQEKAQVKIQTFLEEKQKNFKEQYYLRILQEQAIKEQKQKQIKELEEFEKSLLDQFKVTKVQQQQLLHQLDETQTLKPEEIEEKYPVFASLAQNHIQKNIMDAQQFELDIATGSIHIPQNINPNPNQNQQQQNLKQKNQQQITSSSISPIKIQQRNRQHSYNKVAAPLVLLQQDKNDMSKSYLSKQFYTQQNNNQYDSIQHRLSTSGLSYEKNNSSKNTIQNSGFGNIDRSVKKRKQYNQKQGLNQSAIYEPKYNQQTHQNISPQEKIKTQNDEVQNTVQQHQYVPYLQEDSVSNYCYKINTTPSPEKNNSTKVSLSNLVNKYEKNGIKEKQVSTSNKSNSKLDLSMYQMQNSIKNNKVVSIEDNSSSFLIAAEDDSHNLYQKRNKFNHFGDLMLNRDDIQKQKKQQQQSTQIQQKKSRSKSFVTPNKLEMSSPYRNNPSNYNQF